MKHRMPATLPPYIPKTATEADLQPLVDWLLDEARLQCSHHQDPDGSWRLVYREVGANGQAIVPVGSWEALLNIYRGLAEQRANTPQRA